MTGNVWEWTGTLYSEQTESGINPSGTKDGQRRVLRGGSWAYKDVPTLRSAYRGRLSGLFDPDNYCNGFRVVRNK